MQPPVEILADIFSYFYFDDLRGFECVSKLWRQAVSARLKCVEEIPGHTDNPDGAMCRYLLKRCINAKVWHCTAIIYPGVLRALIKSKILIAASGRASDSRRFLIEVPHRLHTAAINWTSSIKWNNFGRVEPPSVLSTLVKAVNLHRLIVYNPINVNQIQLPLSVRDLEYKEFCCFNSDNGCFLSQWKYLTRLALEHATLQLNTFSSANVPFASLTNLRHLVMGDVKLEYGNATPRIHAFPKQLDLETLEIHSVPGLDEYTNFWSVYQSSCKNLKTLFLGGRTRRLSYESLISHDNCHSITTLYIATLFNERPHTFEYILDFLGHFSKLHHIHQYATTGRFVGLRFPELQSPYGKFDQDYIATIGAKFNRFAPCFRLEFILFLFRQFGNVYTEEWSAVILYIIDHCILPWFPYELVIWEHKLRAHWLRKESDRVLHFARHVEPFASHDFRARTWRFSFHAILDTDNLDRIKQFVELTPSYIREIDIPRASEKYSKDILKALYTADPEQIVKVFDDGDSDIYIKRRKSEYYCSDSDGTDYCE